MVGVDDSIEMRVRTTVWRWPLYLMNLSIQEVERIESECDDNPPNSIERKHTALAAGAVVSSASFLEAIANTIIFDIEQEIPAKERYEFDPSEMRRQILKEYGSVYQDDKQKSLVYDEDTLGKYNSLLKFSTSKFFNQGENPYQDAASVVIFRNQTIHAKPENINRQDRTSPQSKYGDYSTLYGELQGKGTKNPYTSAPLFEYFSEDYSKWAARSVIRFVDEFYSRFGEEPIYKNAIKDLRLSEFRESS